MDIGLVIVYTLMKKQLLEETVPGKPLGFPSLSKMFCILAIAATVLRPSESEAQQTDCEDCEDEFHEYANILNDWYITNVEIPYEAQFALD